MGRIVFIEIAMPSPVLRRVPLGFPWETIDPFLFCAYHDDRYPAGDGRFGPKASLAGRQIGSDFAGQDGWRMYHGEAVPGFPSHPHRGFETVTIVRKGLVDHADSLGAAARFGHGDVQWLTAGKGIVHSEMFPLLETDRENPLELFQIWLNLPASHKMADPHFRMFWAADVPRDDLVDAAGRATAVVRVAGRIGPDDAVTAPPPDSWAAQDDADVAIWTIRMDPGATWTLPAARGSGSKRSLYFFKGATVTVGGERVDAHAALELDASVDVVIANGDVESEFLMLQGRPIGEAVAQYGPFVMNTRQELQQAFDDYQRTRFGGWPWPDDAPVHGASPERFAKRIGEAVESVA